MTWRYVVLAALAALAACDDGVGGDADADADVDGKTDVFDDGGGDADGDGDGDSDGDADGDADADSDGDADGDGDGDGDGDLVPLDGFGAIAGDCGVLDDEEWGSASPFLFRASVDFGATAFDPSLLSEGAQEILAEGTAGGSSGESEALAFDFLYRCELAELVLSETEVVYTTSDSKRTDILVLIDGRDVAVSVVRAMNWPTTDPCQVTNLQDLLEGKLDDALDAELHADPANDWDRSILSVIAYDEQCADAAAEAYAAIDAESRADTILMLTVTDGDDEFIY
jgi:hypothetical protein